MNQTSNGAVFWTLVILTWSIRQGKVEYLQIIGFAALGFTLLRLGASSRSFHYAGIIAVLMSLQLVAAPFVSDLIFTHPGWGLVRAMLNASLGWFMFTGFGDGFRTNRWTKLGLSMRWLRIIYVAIPAITLSYVYSRFHTLAPTSPIPRSLVWLNLGGYSLLLMSAFLAWRSRYWDDRTTLKTTPQ